MINTKKHEYICDKCKCQVNKAKELKKLNSGHYCKKCYQIKRLEKRKQLHDKLKSEGIIGKRRTPEEMEKERRQFPDIKGGKINKPKISSLRLYITKQEKEVLYRKYRELNLSSSEANERIDLICKKMEIVVKDLRKRKINEKEIEIKFKEEFAKLLENEMPRM